jgi:hypothetical protein
MNTEFDYDLTLEQWETLKVLRKPMLVSARSGHHDLERLIALGLVAICGDLPVITSRGRKVLIRGSSRLLDVAA